MVARAKATAEDEFVALARRAVEEYVRHGRRLSLDRILPSMSRPAGAFVTLKQDGRLRGCIGTILPTQPNLGEEIIRNAIEAATRDPRFPPVSPEELDLLSYSVDVLQEPEPVSGTDELDPRRYGVIVSSGPRRGVLLPDLEGIDTPEQQVSIAMQKAGILPGEPITIQRFEVIRHGSK